jgi:hypothetical protein
MRIPLLVGLVFELDAACFKGVLVTDCMEMKAITNAYGPGESAVLPRWPNKLTSW